jgi:hypothetical protein
MEKGRKALAVHGDLEVAKARSSQAPRLLKTDMMYL